MDQDSSLEEILIDAGCSYVAKYFTSGDVLATIDDTFAQKGSLFILFAPSDAAINFMCSQLDIDTNTLENLSSFRKIVLNHVGDSSTSGAFFETKAGTIFAFGGSTVGNATFSSIEGSQYDLFMLNGVLVTTGQRTNLINEIKRHREQKEYEEVDNAVRNYKDDGKDIDLSILQFSNKFQGSHYMQDFRDVEEAQRRKEDEERRINSIPRNVLFKLRKIMEDNFGKETESGQKTSFRIAPKDFPEFRDFQAIILLLTKYGYNIKHALSEYYTIELFGNTGYLHGQLTQKLHTGYDQGHSPPVRQKTKLYTGHEQQQHSPPVAKKPLKYDEDIEHGYVPMYIPPVKSQAAIDRENAALAQQRANREAQLASERARNKALMKGYEKDTELKGKTTSGLQQHEYEETFGGAIMQATGAKNAVNQKKMTVAEARKAAKAQKDADQVFNAKRAIKLKGETTTGLTQHEYDTTFGGAAQKAAQKTKRK